MPISSSDIPGLLLPGLKTAFFNTFTEQAHQWSQIATMIPSDKDSEHYAWLGATPGVNEFIDERRTGDMSEYDYIIKNRTWESTIAVDRAALEDDQYGQVAMRVKQMASGATSAIDILVFDMLAGGFVNPCYDGLPFFGVHPLGKPGQSAPGVQSNMGTDGLGALALQSAITKMMRYQNDQGRPMGIIPDVLVVPPELYWEAAQLLNSAFFPDPAPIGSQDLAMNPLKGLLRLVTSPYLTDPQDWYLFDTKRVVKAIILQMRKDFEFEALEQSSETGFMRDEFFYGVRARYNAGYGDWRACYGSKVD
jgi:phage major head subunit gpT-like protein